MSVYWLVDAAGQVLGSARLRHWLTEQTYRIGGHIGYDIRPDLRGRGLGTLQLRLILDRAARRGMTRVLLTVEEANWPSRRILAKCDAREDRAIIRKGVRHRRYWIWLR
jgi:predicted acetyltransferase